MPKTTQLCTLNGQTFWYVNYILRNCYFKLSKALGTQLVPLCGFPIIDQTSLKIFMKLAHITNTETLCYFGFANLPNQIQ